MVDRNKIMQALLELDPLDDDHWTSDGAPKVEAVSAIVNEKITRQDIVEAAPAFDRSRAGKSEQKTESVDTNSRQYDAARYASWLATRPREDLEHIMTGLNEDLSRIASAQEKLRDESSQIKQAIAQVKLRIRDLFPNSSNSDATREYIESQTRNRAERIGIRNSVLDNLSSEELRGRSPLDEAMARRPTRGSARPGRKS